MLPIINTLLPMVGEVLDRVVPDKNLNAKTKSEIQLEVKRKPQTQSQ